MNRAFFLASATSTMLAFSAMNPALAGTNNNTAEAQSGIYSVEPAHTQVIFSVLHFGFTNYFGAFSNASGTLKLNALTPEDSSLSVTIPVTSVQTTNTRLTDELKGPQWFDATKFPNATFVSTAVKMTGPNDATVTGNLTLHGVTKLEALNVHFLGAGTNPMDKKYTTGFEATGTIKRSDFGIKMYVPYVSDDVSLRIAGAFEKQD